MRRERDRERWRVKLREIAKVLLSEQRRHKLCGAATELYDLLSTVAHEKLHPQARARLLPSGKAISRADAAACTADPIRTAMFLRGICAAVAELRRRLPNGVLDVVYAGTGPFATLVLPLLATGTLTNVHVTFIDIDEISIGTVRQLVELVDGSRHTFVVADAVTYRHARPIHLVITETMQRALTVEPQVAIATNLAFQLHTMGLMVPERVIVDLCAGPPTRAHEYYVGTVMELSLTAIRERAVGLTRTLVMPRLDHDVFYRTSIQTYGEYYIRPGESGLTMREYLWDMIGLNKGEVVTFHYQHGERPRILYNRKATAARLQV